jgi:hypothetical protein
LWNFFLYMQVSSQLDKLARRQGRLLCVYLLQCSFLKQKVRLSFWLFEFFFSIGCSTKSFKLSSCALNHWVRKKVLLLQYSEKTNPSLPTLWRGKTIQYFLYSRSDLFLSSVIYCISEKSIDCFSLLLNCFISYIIK